MMEIIIGIFIVLIVAVTAVVFALLVITIVVFAALRWKIPQRNFQTPRT